MGEIIRIEEMDVSEEEKRLIVRALTDKTFRENLERQASGGAAELNDADLEKVAGGAGSLNLANLRGVLSTVQRIGARINGGAELLCGSTGFTGGRRGGA